MRKIIGPLLSLCLVSFLSAAIYSAPMKAPAKPSPLTSIPKPQFDGFLESSYNYNVNDPASRLTLAHSFDRKNDAFLLNALQVNVRGAAEIGLGYYGAIAFGTDPSFYKAAGNNHPTAAGLPTGPITTSNNFDVPELYLTYKWDTQPISLKLGKFQKLTGIEWLESWKNPTITRGEIFGLAQPFTHVGFLASYQVNPILNFGLGLINGWNLNTDNNSGKTLISKLDIVPSNNLNGGISLYIGPEKIGDSGATRTSADTSWFLRTDERTTVHFQLNYGQEKDSSIADKNGDGVADGGEARWYGMGIQPRFQYSEKVSLGARYEWFYDKDGARAVAPYFTGVNGVTIQNITLCPAYQISDYLLARAEFRYEWASRDGYEDSNGLISKSSVPILSAELIFKF